MSVNDEKRALRRAIREKARLLSPAYKVAASREIERQVFALDAYRKARVVFIFVSMPGEPDTQSIIRNALKTGKRVCVPRCREKPRMDAVEIVSPDALIPGALGIPEPETNEPAIEPESIDLAIVPCVSASPDGRRLGHGGGYYDMYLSGLRCEKVCLCFGQLLCNAIPTAENDVRMDRVITEETDHE